MDLKTQLRRLMALCGSESDTTRLFIMFAASPLSCHAGEQPVCRARVRLSVRPENVTSTLMYNGIDEGTRSVEDKALGFLSQLS